VAYFKLLSTNYLSVVQVRQNTDNLALERHEHVQCNQTECWDFVVTVVL